MFSFSNSFADLFQNSALHYQQPDLITTSLSHYNCGEVYRPSPYYQQTPHDLISTNLSYNGAIGNYSQLPNISKHLSIPITSSAGINMCSIPRNNYYSKASNNTVSCAIFSIFIEVFTLEYLLYLSDDAFVHVFHIDIYVVVISSCLGGRLTDKKIFQIYFPIKQYHFFIS